MYIRPLGSLLVPVCTYDFLLVTARPCMSQCVSIIFYCSCETLFVDVHKGWSLYNTVCLCSTLCLAMCSFEKVSFFFLVHSVLELINAPVCTKNTDALSFLPMQ